MFYFCPPSRDRTYDLVLKRHLLYRLSYGRIMYLSIIHYFEKKFKLRYPFPFFVRIAIIAYMKTTIKATGLELTPSIKEYAIKRVESLEKFIRVNAEGSLGQVEVGMVSRHHKAGDIFRAELNLSVDGEILYAEAQKDDLYAAIDEMHAKAERELIAMKNKKIKSAKRGEASVKKIMRGE